MTEERVGFLYKIASTIFSPQDNTGGLLKSYYLMRCHDLTKSYGLPSRHFSPLSRCSYCCTEWKADNYETSIRPVKLSKIQRRKIKLRIAKETSNVTDRIEKLNTLLNSNKLERKCLLCKHITKIPMEKPQKPIKAKETKANIPITTTGANIVVRNKNKSNNLKKHNKKVDIKVQNNKPAPEINVYNNTNAAFTLAKNNSISPNQPEKVIKNNKKKKDKFAGLCKEAVIAAAKMTAAKTKDEHKLNKLSLFLKPSK